ncbi:hypothetical protein DES53_11546 [Roseimicrobium gellanilyticum]|uniref:Uncharacterized protein n=1 Tax=Roseimicrobium gellanilyticum TaxID=748857 RepID=A0A366H4G7_9BACT|nr:hypothetical protein DES53_11546 [Roseimicrobium gellanilyticum]
MSWSIFIETAAVDRKNKGVFVPETVAVDKENKGKFVPEGRWMVAGGGGL